MSPALAIITGGLGDLGQAIAEALRESGMEVLAPGREALDVASPASVDGYFGQIARPVSLLVNNAATTRDAFVSRMTEQDWQVVMDSNLSGAWRCARAVIPGMTEMRSGHILNIASFSGFSGPLGQANYAASKAGLAGLTQSLAKELGGLNIRVNALMPGFLETKMTASLPAEALEKARLAHVLGRFNTKEHAARFVAFLQNSLPHVSGQIFQLDSRLRRPGW